MRFRLQGGFRRAMKGLVAAAAMAICLTPGPARASTSLPVTNERNAPLIMENADRFEGNRSRGEYILSGKVRFRHGQMLMETERAVWMKDRNIVSCESGMRLTSKGSLLTADRGTYDKNMGQATAQGNVFMRDSSGENVATGQNVVYLRFRHLATLTGNPEVRRFYVKKDSAAPDSVSLSASAKAQDSAKPASKSTIPVKSNVPVPMKAAAKANPKAPDSATATAKAGTASKNDGPDTLSIKGDIMTYNDSSEVAVSDGNVRINRDKLKITCKKAEYHGGSDSLYLLGEPQVVADGNQVKGDIMRLGMHGEELKSLLVKGSAQAHSTEPGTDTSSARQSDVNGDSLFLAFKEKAIDSVQVFKNATGAYFDVDKPDFVNKMTGDYMVLRFNGKQVTSANVMGGGLDGTAAKSTYYHFEKKRLKGKNDAEGDTIDFAFKDGKVDEVMVKGAAKGTYFGEKAKGKNGAQDSAAAGAEGGAVSDSAKPGASGLKPAPVSGAQGAPVSPAKPVDPKRKAAPATAPNAPAEKKPTGGAAAEKPKRKPIWRDK
jgi:lipopolysaccharide export system protein LptA